MTEGVALSDSAAPEISNGNVVRAVIAFNTLTLIGAFMVALVISVPMFSSNIHRSKLWFSQMVSWLVYSFSYMLLLGRQLKPEEPPFGICMFQAALIYASPPLVALSATCFVIDFYLQLAGRLNGRRCSRVWEYTLLVLPSLVYVIVFLEVILVDPSTIQRDHASYLYCHSSLGTPTLVSAILVVLSGIISLPLEVWIGILIYRHWKAFRRQNVSRSGTSLSMYIRIALFSITVFISMGLGTFIITRVSISVPHWSVVLPAAPILAAIAFGTQRDILQALLICGRIKLANPKLKQYITRPAAGP